jgi:hypothetical protein
MPDALPPPSPETDPTLRLLREGARAVAAAHPHALATEGWDRTAWRDMAARGWFHLHAPASIATLAEACGEALLPEPVVALGLLPAALLRAAAPSALRDRLLTGVTAGEMILPVAWQSRAEQLVPEPTQARITGSGGARLVLTGTRRLVPDALRADGFLVAAERDGGIALAHVPPRVTGLTVSPRRLPDGSTDATLRFEQLVLSDEALLAEQAGPILATALEAATLALAAQLLGVGGSALAAVAAHLGRRAHDPALASFGASHHPLVELGIEQHEAASALHLALDQMGGDPTMRAQALSYARFRCAQAALLGARQAAELAADPQDAAAVRHLHVAQRLAGLLGTAQAHRMRATRLRPAEAAARAA